MPENYAPFVDVKGRSVKVYAGDGTTRDRVITLTQRGTPIDITGFGPIQMFVVEEEKPISDAILSGVVCAQTGPIGQITVPFSAQNITRTIEGAIFIFVEVVGGKNQIIKKFQGDILRSNTDDVK